jgi:hypothetical protein
VYNKNKRGMIKMSTIHRLGQAGKIKPWKGLDGWLAGIDVEKTGKAQGIEGLMKILEGLKKTHNMSLTDKQRARVYDITQQIMNYAKKYTASQEQKAKIFKACKYICIGVAIGAAAFEVGAGAYLAAPYVLPIATGTGAATKLVMDPGEPRMLVYDGYQTVEKVFKSPQLQETLENVLRSGDKMVRNLYQTFLLVRPDYHTLGLKHIPWCGAELENIITQLAKKG